MIYKSKLMSAISGGLLTAFLSFGQVVHAQEVDLSPEQKGRIRVEKVDAAAKLIPADYKFITPGKLTIATVPFRLPLVDYASDAKTPIGIETDIAQLVADSLGSSLNWFRLLGPTGRWVSRPVNTTPWSPT